MSTSQNHLPADSQVQKTNVPLRRIKKNGFGLANKVDCVYWIFYHPLGIYLEMHFIGDHLSKIYNHCVEEGTSKVDPLYYLVEEGHVVNCLSFKKTRIDPETSKVLPVCYFDHTGQCVCTLLSKDFKSDIQEEAPAGVYKFIGRIQFKGEIFVSGKVTNHTIRSLYDGLTVCPCALEALGKMTDMKHPHYLCNGKKMTEVTQPNRVKWQGLGTVTNVKCSNSACGNHVCVSCFSERNMTYNPDNYKDAFPKPVNPKKLEFFCSEGCILEYEENKVCKYERVTLLWDANAKHPHHIELNPRAPGVLVQRMIKCCTNSVVEGKDFCEDHMAALSLSNMADLGLPVKKRRIDTEIFENYIEPTPEQEAEFEKMILQIANGPCLDPSCAGKDLCELFPCAHCTKTCSCFVPQIII
jgi:hypothetical protein